MSPRSKLPFSQDASESDAAESSDSQQSQPHCHHQADAADHCHGESHTPVKTAVHATLHCLTGCTIGEVLGLLIGVHYGFSPMATMALAFVLAYISGFTLAIWPIMQQQNLSFTQAFKIVWIGELISIFVMEVAMNATDYWIGGVQASGIDQPIFWIGMGAAIVAGFIAALPVNYWLLKKELKACH